MKHNFHQHRYICFSTEEEKYPVLFAQFNIAIAMTHSYTQRMKQRGCDVKGHLVLHAK